MSKQSAQTENAELSPSGLLLSIEPLQGSEPSKTLKLSADDTDASDDTATDTDETDETDEADGDGTDGTDGDGTDGGGGDGDTDGTDATVDADTVDA